jgi:hypothetical protein
VYRRLTDVAAPSDLILAQTEIVSEAKYLFDFPHGPFSWATNLLHAEWRNFVPWLSSVSAQMKLFLENHSDM